MFRPHSKKRFFIKLQTLRASLFTYHSTEIEYYS